MSQYVLDAKKYERLARETVAEGCVLLKNERQTLPLRKGDKVAVFGRCMSCYYKSGLGSGGLVNTRYTVGILDALKTCGDITIHQELLDIYEEWLLAHPYEEGEGWGTVPWSQQEMPVTDEMLKVSQDADVALVIIGRTAGEDQDNSNEEGSFLLTSTEKEMIAKVSRTFKRTAVLLNVGNIIDMTWVEECDPGAVMYVWQGGQEGGNGVVDVLSGAVSPSGKLTDTIAASIDDYPSTKNFGDKTKNYYEEDIYVGYRYFESCCKEKVLYPFGYGLSYTKFAVHGKLVLVQNDTISIEAEVKNIGNEEGKEVVQVYIEAPDGKLGKPSRVLSSFYKTACLKPGETEKVTLRVKKSEFASYDDAGITGHKSCFLLEQGTYRVYLGTDVRSAEECGSWEQEEMVLEQLEEACAPVEPFSRLVVRKHGNTPILEQQEVPVATVDRRKRMEALRGKELAYTGDRGYLLGDVLDGKVTMDDFISQLADSDLMSLFYGEGMCSLKVTPGTAGAFGGLTKELKAFGIPAACCADGPSGIRMDCGTKAFSLPNGTALGCTFNLKLVESLYGMLGLELRKNRIDTLLGPGINIHRNPLNGRNFEYISEDPLLTGRMAAAQLKGMHSAGVTGTVKHFCGNNQEYQRNVVEAVVSERALREIYLRCFEIAVKEGEAKSIMTTYGPVNGLWTAGNYDLCSIILRNQWGFSGIVMTDWWAMANDETSEAKRENRAPIVVAQNDLYMCCDEIAKALEEDNVKEAFRTGMITRSDLQRNAKNILTFIMNSPAMLYELGRISEEELAEWNKEEEDLENMEGIEFYMADPATNTVVLDGKGINTSGGSSLLFGMSILQEGEYSIDIRMKSWLNKLAQLPLSIYIDNVYRTTISLKGTEGEVVEVTRNLGYFLGKDHVVKLVFGATGIDLEKITFRCN